MNNDSEPKRGRMLLRRTFRWGFLPLLGVYVLFSIWFYLYQDPVLLKPNGCRSGSPETSLKPSMDVFLDPPEAQINIQKFDTPTDPPKGTVFFSTVTEETLTSACGKSSPSWMLVTMCGQWIIEVSEKARDGLVKRLCSQMPRWSTNEFGRNAKKTTLLYGDVHSVRAWQPMLRRSTPRRHWC